MKIDGKSVSAMMLAVLFILTLFLVPAVSAKNLGGSIVITYNDWGVPGPDPRHTVETMYWKGSFTLNGASGTIYFWETDRNFMAGKTEHFFEEFYIDLGVNGYIYGYDYGLWNFGTTWKFRSEGFITGASSGYEDMIGCKFFEMGYTDAFSGTLPLNGACDWYIGP